MTTYLKKRGNIYWFQRAVPKDVKPTIGRVNWAQSLKTSDIQTAKIRVRELAVETDQQIKRARDAEKVEELNRFAHRHMADLVSNPPRTAIDLNQPIDFSKVLNAPKPSFHDAFDKYIEDADLKDSTRTDFRIALRRFKEVVSPKPVAKIDRVDIETFRDLLRRMPSRPPDIIRKQPMAKQVEWAEKQPTVKIMQHATVSKNLTAIKSALDWCFNETSLIEDRNNWHNPATGFITKPKTTRKDRRRRFTDDQIEFMFSPEVYFEMNTLERYWLPLCLLFTGARLDEIAQTRVSDLKVDPIPYFDLENLEDDILNTKTESGRRHLPLHDDLLELGFMTYANSLPKDGFLFPNLNHDRGKERGAAVSKAFMSMFRKHPEHGFNKHQVTHSLRHTFKHKALESGVSENLAQVALGHYVDNMSLRVYGSDVWVMPGLLKRNVMDKITFPNLKVPPPPHQS